MKYNVVHINGSMYVVDRKVEMREGSTYSVTKRHLLDGFTPIATLLATNNKENDLPLLPAVENFSSTNSPLGSEHNINTLYARILHIGEFMETNGTCKGHDKEWGKTLRSTVRELMLVLLSKRYTEENMRKAFKAGESYGRASVGEFYGGNENEKLDYIEYLNLIRPKPITVELEMNKEYKDIPDMQQWQQMNPLEKAEYKVEITPVVDKNNYVIVKQWYYEETNK